ncbi:aquaporin NIP6-1-like [Cicer arietinum]|uniref:Aquaporin NIP6-1-like n=1 Tax=Cicer arietinum TaxID=3827 RepID=A0A1S2Z5R6_CICAR|nr:aquaporin NIP6-1-like [Cicer arietinum]
MNNEEISSISSTPASATPGTPLFCSLRYEKNENRSVGRKKSLLKNMNCFAIEEWNLEDGSLPRVSCALSLPHAPIPLAKKVEAEFIGTFILMFAGMGSAIENEKVEKLETLIGCVGASGLAVMIIILSTGHIYVALKLFII